MADREHSTHLDANDVHVRFALLDADPADVERHAQTLSDDELARAERFAFDADREDYVVARGTLRSILGSYLALDPKSISFRYGSHGKPELEDSRCGLSFNVAHSHGVVLYAIARNAMLGVDVECIRGDLAETQLADQFFAPGESAALHALPEAQQLAAFFRCWTRKEAFVKANGLGLSFELDEFEVSLHPETAQLLSIRGDSAEAFRWAMHSFIPCDGFVAALAIDRRHNVFKYFSVKS